MRNAALAAVLAALTLSPALSPAAAEQPLQVTGAYASINRPGAPAGAVYMTIENPAATPDRLLSARASVAEKTTLHTSRMSADGLMQMLDLPEGLVIPAQGTAAFAPGADHVMMVGLNRPLATGDRFTLDLTFEAAGKVVVIVTVGDAATHMSPMDHSGHGTSDTP
jgi:periplasmic copper chaperone A